MGNADFIGAFLNSILYKSVKTCYHKTQLDRLSAVKRRVHIRMPYRESPEEFRTVHSIGSLAERRMDLRNVEDGLGALHLNLHRLGCNGFTRYRGAL